MIEFQTKNTDFSKDIFAQIFSIRGIPVENPSAMGKMERILKKLLPYTSLKGVLELNVTDSTFEFTASSRKIGTNRNGILAGVKTINSFNDATVAVLLGHEIGHLVKGVGTDGDGQANSDLYGLNLALKAGYQVADMIEYLQELKRLASLPNNEDDPYGRIDQVQKWIDSHTSRSI